MAVSLACRLGFAKKKDQPPTSSMSSPNTQATGDGSVDGTAIFSALTEDVKVAFGDGDGPVMVEDKARVGTSGSDSGSMGTRLAFLVDSKLAACLMMSNLAAELKQHAVTLYEVRHWSRLMSALHSFILLPLHGGSPKFPQHRQAATTCFKADPQRSTTDPPNSHPPTRPTLPISTSVPCLLWSKVGKIPAESLPAFLEAAAAVVQPAEPELLEYFEHAIALRHAVLALRAACPNRPLDIVRTESLRELSPSTLVRVLDRSYGMLVSMAPLISHSETVFSDQSRVPHFGPLSPILVSPWLRLAIYESCQAGAPSLLLRRGTRLRSLPLLLEEAPHLLITSWQGESSVVQSSAALLSLNEALLYSPVLIQAYEPDLASVLHVAFPVSARDLSQCRAGAASAAELVRSLGLEKAFGYVTLLDRNSGWEPFDIRLGLPLFDLDLCKEVCAAIQRECLLEDESVKGMAQATKALVSRLAAFASHYAPHTASLEGCCGPTKASIGLPWVSRLFESEDVVTQPVQNLFFDGKELCAFVEAD